MVSTTPLTSDLGGLEKTHSSTAVSIRLKALDGINLEVRKREVLGLVGESGCGKSVTTLAIAGLLPENSMVVSGEVLLNGEDLLKKNRSRSGLQGSRTLL